METFQVTQTPRTGLNAYTVVRVLLGLLFVVNAPIAFFISPQQMALNLEATRTLQSLWDTGYLMQVVKGIELIVGLGLLLNRYVPLMLVLIMPVALNIVLLDLFKEPKGLLLSLPVLIMIIYLMTKHLNVYRPMLTIR